MAWYDPDELKYQADHDQKQPEFAPLHGPDDPLNDDEAIRIEDDIPVEDEILVEKVDAFVARTNEIKAITDNT